MLKRERQHLTKRMRRTWPQRAVLLLGTGVFAGCLLGGAGIWYGNGRLGQIQRVDIRTAAGTQITTTSTTVVGRSTTTEEPVPEGTITAKNFLIVGSDSRECIEPDSPFAGAFLAGGDTGYNSDSIMMIRVDPTSSQAALLSFPRDLWVKLPGTNASGKINSVYSPGNPSRLVQAIELNFKVKVDHYIDVDFCAFKDIVDAVGGVSVPFAYLTRDTHTGLDVAAGCHKFAGDEALAYVRSRYYEYFDTKAKSWISDLDSDYGRIARQQDFIRRAMYRAIDSGARSPATSRKLLNAALKRVKVDRELTVNDMLLLVSKLRNFDPARLKTYRYDGPFGDRAGQSVVLPAEGYGPNVAILALFRGEVRLDDSPFAADLPTGSSSTSSSTSPPTTSALSGSSTTTTAVIRINDNRKGVAPPDDPSCR